LNRVEVTRIFVGLLYMQVCTEADATDEEILAVCNRENPSGTTLGWCAVERAAGDGAPVACAEHPERVHFLVSC
jgi:hypothetical protein